MRTFLLGVFLLLAGVAFIAAAQTLQIQAIPSQGVILGENYSLPLVARGGSAPYTWRLLSGDLPPGLTLHPHSGRITGAATTPGDYSFTVSVADSSVPALQSQRDFVIHVIAGLTVDWKELPAVHGNSIRGSAVVSNQTAESFDLTVVIVAVNKIGRATTLGYQHLNLAAGSSSPVIPFSSSPGNGSYYVRVDAVAQRPGRKHVFRASKQTSDPLKLSQL